jgi:hypothetical protein
MREGKSYSDSSMREARGELKFIRRPDLDMWTRMELALIMNRRNIYEWGTVTDSARAYGVSRQFLYENYAFFASRDPVWFMAEPTMMISDEFIHHLILCAKLHCGASIDGIVETLKELGCKPGSAGYISKFLKEVGRACEIEIPDTARPVALLLDETFTQNRPILVIMEASSHFVMSITLAPDRKASTWESELKRLEELGIDIEYLVKDQGTSLKAAAVGRGIPERADLFHLLKPFDPFLPSLERHAYGTIEEQMERERVFNNRKTEKTLRNALEKYEEATEKKEEAIRNFDDYDYLHKCLHESFDSFSAEGDPRGKMNVAGDVEAGLALLEELFGDNDKIRAAIKFLRGNLDDYWGYTKQLEKIIRQYAEVIPEHTLRFLCVSWQLAKKAMAVKNSKLKNKLTEQAAEWMNVALTGADEVLKNNAGKLLVDLDANIRSSSPLEAINSVIRGFLNSSRGQVTSESLNMIAFHINHKVATRGKYAGTSAFMRLTGKTYEETSIQRLAKLSPRAETWDDDVDENAG